jgi:transcriptional regulator with XRE-family HTH domain
MTIEEKLKNLILARYKSLREFVKHTDMSYTTVDSILRRGIGNSSLTNILKLCNALEISADELANGKIIPIDEKVQKKSMTEINDILFFVKGNDNLTIDGQKMSEDEIEILFDAIDIGIGIIKRKRERVKS